MTHTPDPAKLPVEGEELEIALDSLGHGGEAVGRVNGFVHFVVDGAPGDRALVRVREVKRSFARSELVSVLVPSADRTTPRCPYVGTCGGCHLQHLTPAAQRRAREAVLRDTLVRLGRLSDPVIRPTVSRDAWQTRHRITLHAHREEERLVIGFVDRAGSAIVPIERCAIARPEFEPVIRALHVLARNTSVAPTVSGGPIELRMGLPAEHVHVVLGAGVEPLAVPLLNALEARSEIARMSVHWLEEGRWRHASTHRGSPLRLETPWATFLLPPDAFYQVYPALAIEMAKTVRELAAAGQEDRVLDLFAGAGFLAAALARDAKEVFCLEGHAGAARAGERTFREASIRNAHFVTGPVERTLRSLPRGGSPTIVVVDPPRTGLSRSAVEGVLGHAPVRVVYVSCEPATLARDVKLFVEAGYRHALSIPFDFFPQTYHFESVTLLELEGRS